MTVYIYSVYKVDYRGAAVPKIGIVRKKKRKKFRNTYHQCIKVTTISSNNQATNENNQHIFGAFNKIKFEDFLF